MRTASRPPTATRITGPSDLSPRRSFRGTVALLVSAQVGLMVLAAPAVFGSPTVLGLPPAIGAVTVATGATEELPAAPGESSHVWIRVELDPPTGKLRGEATLRVPDPAGLLDPEGALPIELHQDLFLISVRQGEADVAFRRAEMAEDSTGPDIWLIVADAEALATGIDMVWQGVLRDDILSGERPGQIHNDSVETHIGIEGTYLAPHTAWHPRLGSGRLDDWPHADLPRSIFHIEIRSPHRLVVSGNRIDESDDLSSVDQPHHWRTPFPVEGVAVAGGGLVDNHRRVGDVVVRTLLLESSAAFSENLLEAAASYLELYQPFIGPYPFREFVIVENFFSSGFAFPGFTLLSSAVIGMGDGGLRAGYLDHELLHSWFGNGVLSSRDGGHWSEAVASYLANYLRPIIEDGEVAGIDARRSIQEGLSRVPERGRRVLGDYGTDEEVSRYIGYQKGSLVLAQLEQEVGRETLMEGFAEFVATHLGAPATWKDFQAAIETASGRDLDDFFDFWFYGPGLIQVSFDPPTWNDRTSTLNITVRVDDSIGTRIVLEAAEEDQARSNDPLPGQTIRRSFDLQPGTQKISWPLDHKPGEIRVDPEYLTLRLLPAELQMPTLSALGPPGDLTIAIDSADQERFAPIADQFQQRYKNPKQVHRTKRVKTGHLKKGHVIALGTSALSKPVADLLPGYSLEPTRFADGETSHDGPAEAILLCTRIPTNPGSHLCVYTGNSDAAYVRSDLLPFYGGNSLILFDAGSPGERADFVRTQTLPVS